MLIEYVPKRQEVHVSFDFESDIKSKSKTFLEKIFADRPVEIGESNYYNSFKIINNTRVDKDRIAREKALAKLSDEEKKILGL